MGHDIASSYRLAVCEQPLKFPADQPVANKATDRPKG